MSPYILRPCPPFSNIRFILLKDNLRRNIFGGKPPLGPHRETDGLTAILFFTSTPSKQNSVALSLYTVCIFTLLQYCKDNVTKMVLLFCNVAVIAVYKINVQYLFLQKNDLVCMGGLQISSENRKSAHFRTLTIC
jgi:hypothetical protein